MFHDTEPLLLDKCQVRGEHKVALSRLLSCLGLNVAYHRGHGDFLYYRDDCGVEIEVLDLVGGYGTLLLGHNHPALVEEAQQMLSACRPQHAQASLRPLAEQLADELARRLGRDICAVFANSGTEAVEAAMKHALLETGGRTFLALDGAFHGKTLGALQLTANPAFREPFATSLNVVRVPPDDIEQLTTEFSNSRDVAGFFLEPILGEGGVRPLTRQFAQRVADLCRARKVPLIADECQTGLGRTGTYLASEALGIEPDYVILSKALGGGLAKISALLIKRQRYVPDFDLLHTSTFADDDFSCAIALRTLGLLDRRLIDRCRIKGEWLRQQLDRLRRVYPQAVKDVRGAGLMIGIELRVPTRSASVLMRQIAARGLLGAVVSGHLLRANHIRIATTLSEPSTLRIQPSALISDVNLSRVVNAIEDVCKLLTQQDVVTLTSHLGDADGVAPVRSGVMANTIVDFKSAPVRYRAGRPRHSFAWLFHLIDGCDAPHLEPALKPMALVDQEAFLDRLAPLAEPIVMPEGTIESASGDRVGIWPILLPVTSAWIKRQMAIGRRRGLSRLLDRATGVAETLGVDLISLGQFTSIMSRNGRTVSAERFGVTTGNSYTAALIVESVRRAQAETGVPPQRMAVAIIGAAGNIGRACAEMLAADFGRVILVGRDRPSTRQALAALAARIGDAEISSDISAVRAADVVVCATSSTEPFLDQRYLKHGAIVCDASVPPTVLPETAQARPDLLLFRGGIARLPFGRLDIPGFPLRDGYAFGCMAEGALLCLEQVRDSTFTGRLCREKIARVAGLAMRHGFQAADCGDGARLALGSNAAADLQAQASGTRECAGNI